MLQGIDISQYQPNVDFTLLKTQLDFVIIRASYGVGFVDKCFIDHQTKARASSLLVGFYHYAYPQYNTPESEADWFLQTVGTLQAGEILCLDFEEKWSGDVVNWCKRFLDQVSVQLNGYLPIIYLNKSQITSFNWTPVINAGYKLWVASYDNDPTLVHFSTPWEIVAMKQYTDAGTVSGIVGNVDADSFFGDEHTFKMFGIHPKKIPTQVVSANPVATQSLAINPQTVNQLFMSSLQARKFVLSTFTSGIAVIGSKFDPSFALHHIWLIIAPLITIIVAEGIVDMIYKAKRSPI